MADYDIVVLGGGPGGYATALYAASAGLSVALVEADKVGGTCLHRGCIPAKALLHAAEVFRTVNHAAEHGVKLPGGGVPEPDWPAANKRKAGIVGNLHKGLSGLLKRRKVNVVFGWGRLTADGAVSVTAEGGGTQTLSGRAVIICAGSAPRAIPGMDVDGATVITSDQSTNSDAEKLPERVAVIGGGVIGAEFASVFTDLGVSDHAAGGPAEPDPAARAGPRRRERARPLADPPRPDRARRGPGRHAGAHRAPGSSCRSRPPRARRRSRSTRCSCRSGAARSPRTSARPRRASRLTDRGFVDVDPTTMLTSRPGVYAIGDCVNTPGLAHVAYAEAVVAVEHFLGEHPVPVDYGKVPWVVYTHPEVAWSGMTEAYAKEAGYDVEVHKHSLAGNGRAMILGETDGLVKIVAQKGGPVLGFHMVGPWASELMHEGYLAVNWEALPAEVGHLIHAHPSLSEAIGETMITFSGRSLHG